MGQQFKLKNKKGEVIYNVDATKVMDGNGNDLLQIMTDDLIILLRPRKDNKPTLIMFSPGIGKPVIAKQDERMMAIEIYSDNRQVGLVPNPITVSQKVLATTQPSINSINSINKVN